MTINLRTLKCGECGSGQLQRSGLNQYTCQHCRSVSVVEDKVSERLDRVLEQVKNAAAERLAAEQAARQRLALRIAGIVGAGVLGIGVLAAGLAAFFGTKPQPARTRPAVAAAPVERPIPVEGLRLEAPRQVLAGSGGSAQPRLLVIARNETGRPLSRPSVAAEFHAGEERLGGRSESLPVDVLAPGESVPLLIDLPRDRSVTRQDLQVQRLSPPARLVDGPRLAFSRVRLVQQKDAVRLVGRLVNDRADATLAGCEVLVTLYDDAGGVIGLGRGHAQAAELRPGERTSMDLRIERFGGAAPIAAWDYRIGYHLRAGDGTRSPVLAADRVIRAEGGPQAFHPDLRLGSEDLLAEDGERFDPAQLELLPLVAGRDNIQRAVYLTELVNRSADAIVLAPGAVVSQFDGSRPAGARAIQAPAYLYPGERFPVLLQPQDADRITQTRIEWKPMRRAALPGPRVPLEVQVDGTRAQTGSVLLNFSRRFLYKYVEVQGRVSNPGSAIVRKARLWVSLRDREGRLTGLRQVDDLPAIGPGDSVPFTVDVAQYGRDFARVETFYQTE